MVKKLAYPAIASDGVNRFTITMIDFPDISIDASNREFAYKLVYDALEERIYDLAYEGKPIPEPMSTKHTYKPEFLADHLIYITIPFERKEFFWNKPFLDRCIACAVLVAMSCAINNYPLRPSTFFVLVIFWLILVALFSIVSGFTFYVHPKLDWQKCTLAKRIFSIIIISIIIIFAGFIL